MIDTPKLHDNDLTLVPLSAQYEAFYIALANNPAVREHVNNSIPYLREHFEELLSIGTQQRQRHVWIIEQAGVPKGAITFGPTRSHPQVFQGGYWIDPSVWGQGLTSRALTRVKDFLFTQCKAERVQALVEPTNLASMRVLEKNGFHNEGLLRKFYPSRHRGLLDVYMYALTAPGGH